MGYQTYRYPQLLAIVISKTYVPDLPLQYAGRHLNTLRFEVRKTSLQQKGSKARTKKIDQYRSTKDTKTLNFITKGFSFNLRIAQRIKENKTDANKKNKQNFMYYWQNLVRNARHLQNNKHWLKWANSTPVICKQTKVHYTTACVPINIRLTRSGVSNLFRARATL